MVEASLTTVPKG